MTFDFETIQVLGRTHVVRHVERPSKHYPEPNYRGTGKALCGVTREGESLEAWIRRTKIAKLKREAIE